MLLAGGFLWADAQANRAMQTEDGTVLQSLARQLAGKSIYIIDGEYYDQEKIDALAEGKTLLECQFEGSVYGEEPFAKWVDATKGIAGDSNPLSDILHYASGVFDQKNRDSYRADVEARLAECKMQALALVAQTQPSGSGEGVGAAISLRFLDAFLIPFRDAAHPFKAPSQCAFDIWKPPRQRFVANKNLCGLVDKPVERGCVEPAHVVDEQHLLRGAFVELFARKAVLARSQLRGCHIAPQRRARIENRRGMAFQRIDVADDSEIAVVPVVVGDNVVANNHAIERLFCSCGAKRLAGR